MKTIFILVLFIPSCSSHCWAKNVAETVEDIVKWIGNGFSSKPHDAQSSKNGEIYAECLSTLINGQTQRKCQIEKATKSVLPTCDVLFKNKTFITIVKEEIGWHLVHQAYLFFNNVVLHQHVSADLCEKMKEYVKARMQMSEGGHFDKSKMDKYCNKNEDVCEDWNIYFEKESKVLYEYLKLVKRRKAHEIPKYYTLEEAKDKFIEGTVDNVVFGVRRKWANQLIKTCLEGFIKIIREKLG